MDTCEVLIRNANVFDVGKGLDIAVRDGKIVQIGPDLPMTASTELRADNKLVVPGFVESHTHLDKSFTAVDEDTPNLQEAYGIFAR